MSNESPSPEFWVRADAIIHLANEQCKNAPNGKVSSSLLYAAARFSAYNVAANVGDLEEMKSDKEEAIKFFTEQFKKMLIENMDDYIENFDQYIAPKTNA